MMVFMVLIGMEMVVSRGNAPRSSGYQPGALLLSYKTEMERRSVLSERLSLVSPGTPRSPSCGFGFRCSSEPDARTAG